MVVIKDTLGIVYGAHVGILFDCSVVSRLNLALVRAGCAGFCGLITYGEGLFGVLTKLGEILRFGLITVR